MQGCTGIPAPTGLSFSSKSQAAHALGFPAVRRAYNFRLRPTRKQEAALSACLEDTRQLYNAALEERREA
jgi:hypothetical protein